VRLRELGDLRTPPRAVAARHPGPLLAGLAVGLLSRFAITLFIALAILFFALQAA
jgi:hypothetical protein